VTYRLRARKLEQIVQDGKLSWCSALDVVDESGKFVEQFMLMPAAMFDDIHSHDGPVFLEAIRRVEAGEVDKIEADGNAWVAHITRDKVWFEGLYSQGEGGEVSLAQYKLAVETYVRFLSDREQKPIEVPFPEGP
jgi:hypothetical protein